MMTPKEINAVYAFLTAVLTFDDDFVEYVMCANTIEKLKAHKRSGMHEKYAWIHIAMEYFYENKFDGTATNTQT